MQWHITGGFCESVNSLCVKGPSLSTVSERGFIKHFTYFALTHRNLNNMVNILQTSDTFKMHLDMNFTDIFQWGSNSLCVNIGLGKVLAPSMLYSIIEPHYNDVTMSKVASQITSLTIVYSTVYSGPDQTKHQSSASLAFVRGIHRGPVNSPHKWPVNAEDVSIWWRHHELWHSLLTSCIRRQGPLLLT